MSAFKERHFEGEIVHWAVRWYCRCGISYRDLEQMMGERGVQVDHGTIERWVQKYAPRDGKAPAFAVAPVGLTLRQAPLADCAHYEGLGTSAHGAR